MIHSFRISPLSLALASSLSIGVSTQVAAQSPAAFKLLFADEEPVEMRDLNAGSKFSVSQSGAKLRVDLAEPLLCFSYETPAFPSSVLKLSLRQPNLSEEEEFLGVGTAVFGPGEPSSDYWLSIAGRPGLKCFAAPDGTEAGRQAEIQSRSAVIFSSSLEDNEATPDLAVKVCSSDEAGQYLAANPSATVAPGHLCSADQLPERRDGNGGLIAWDPINPVPFAAGQTISYSIKLSARYVSEDQPLQGVSIRDLPYTFQGASPLAVAPDALECHVRSADGQRGSSSSGPGATWDCQMDAVGRISILVSVGSLSEPFVYDALGRGEWIDVRLTREVTLPSPGSTVKTAVAAVFDPKIDETGRATVIERDFFDNFHIFAFS
jgi:hypothetical protein